MFLHSLLLTDVENDRVMPGRYDESLALRVAAVVALVKHNPNQDRGLDFQQEQAMTAFGSTVTKVQRDRDDDHMTLLVTKTAGGRDADRHDVASFGTHTRSGADRD